MPWARFVLVPAVALSFVLLALPVAQSAPSHAAVILRAPFGGKAYLGSSGGTQGCHVSATLWSTPAMN
ncbi:MAG: hypothetical protein L3K08_06075, partial [Thermoplasmata archaeon]|nr:hypothetical protein [Thermoplasmata archaeon]